jgi:membrane protein implicated in regulation of membrane protease activity
VTTTDVASGEGLTVEFGPLEQRGVLLGVSGPGIALIAASIPLCLVCLLVGSGALGLVVGVAALSVGVAGALVQVRGATSAEWALVLLAYLWRAVTGRRQWASGAPTLGRHSAREDSVADLPMALRRARMRIVGVPWGDRVVGIVIDGNLAIGVLRARSAGAFLMMEPGDQAALTGHWAELIGSIADAGSPWVRLQWIDTTTPVDGGALARFVADAMCPSARQPGTPEHDARSTYERLLHRAAPVSESHDLLLALAMDPRRVVRQVRDAGGGDRGLSKVCVRALEQVAYKLASGEVLVDGALSVRQIGEVLRRHVDPSEHRYQAEISAEGDSAVLAGIDPASAWTLLGDEHFSTHRTDGAVHTTLWVKEWPRRPSRVDFLAPLLLRTGSIARSISVVMAPVDGAAALRAAEGAATADESDDALRQRFGVRTSSRRRREHEMAHRREDELVDGYDDVRFSAYVTVSAPDVPALEEAVAEVHAQARAARMRLVRLAGQQAEAFWYTAPLARGVR